MAENEDELDVRKAGERERLRAKPAKDADLGARRGEETPVAHPASAGPTPIEESLTALQSAAGNAAVAGLLSRQRGGRSHRGTPVVESSGGSHEREADAAAAKVMSSSESSGPRLGSTDSVQHHPTLSEDVRERLESQVGRGSPLPAETKGFMESRFGTEFGDVRVHADEQASQLASDMSARAFTHGAHVFVGKSRYEPYSRQGRLLLAHELAHVVQQRGQVPAVQRQEEPGKPEGTAPEQEVLDVRGAKAPAKAKPGDLAKAKALYDRARRAMKAKDFNVARHLYEEAHDLVDRVDSDDPLWARSLYGLGEASMGCKLWREAWEAFDQYVNVVHPAIDAASLAKARALLDKANEMMTQEEGEEEEQEEEPTPSTKPAPAKKSEPVRLPPMRVTRAKKGEPIYLYPVFIHPSKKRMRATGPGTKPAAALPGTMTWDQLKEEARRAASDLRRLQIWERMRQMPERSAVERGELLWNMGKTNFELGRFATSMIYLEEMSALPGLDEESYRHANETLAQARKKLGIPESEGDHFDPGEAKKLADRLMQEADDARRAARFGLAIQRYERIRHLPGLSADQEALTIFSMGVCNYLMGRIATAVIYLEQCASNTDLDPRHRWTARGMLQISRKQLGVPKELIDLPPEDLADLDAKALAKRAETAYKGGETDEAYDLFEQVLLLQPEQKGKIAVRALYMMGMCMVDLQEWDSAILSFEQCRRTPGDAETSARAAEKFEELHKKYPDSPRFDY